MSEHKNEAPKQEQQYSLNDDRRVKVLSPGALVARRFFRNRLAVIGLSILIAMFLFSFLGGVISPYGQDEQFYTYTQMSKEYVGFTRNDAMRFVVADGQEFGSIAQSKALDAFKKGQAEFNYKDVDYTIEVVSDDTYAVYRDGEVMGYASRDLINAVDGGEAVPFAVKLAALKAEALGERVFEADGADYELDDAGNIMQNGAELGYISRIVVSAADPSIVITRDFREKLEEAVDRGDEKFNYTDENGETAEYDMVFDASTNVWSVKQMKDTYVYDRYSAPSKEHLLGTDTNGMDMLTRLMYGGRVSLIIGFIVVAIEASLGILLGGISGYFGGRADHAHRRRVLLHPVDADHYHHRLGHGCDEGRFLDTYGLSDADPGLPRLAGHCPSGARPDPLAARAGVHAGDGGRRHPRLAPHLPAPHSERHPAADRHLHDGPRLDDHDGGDAVVPRSWRQISVRVVGQHHQRCQ